MNNEPHRCPSCNSAYGSDYDLKRHMTLAHQDHSADETPRQRREILVSAIRKPREGEWTSEQDQMLKDNAHLGREGCAAKIGRTTSAVSNRAHALGVSLKRRPAPGDTPTVLAPKSGPPTSDPAAWTDSEAPAPATNAEETDDTRTSHNAAVLVGLGKVDTRDIGDGTYAHVITSDFTPDEPAPKTAASCRGFGCTQDATGDDGLCDRCRSPRHDGAVPRHEDLFEPRECRVCGCTDAEACEADDGSACHWVEEDLCSACAAKTHAVEVTLVNTPEPLVSVACADDTRLELIKTYARLALALVRYGSAGEIDEAEAALERIKELAS